MSGITVHVEPFPNDKQELQFQCDKCKDTGIEITFLLVPNIKGIPRIPMLFGKCLNPECGETDKWILKPQFQQIVTNDIS